MTLKTFDDLEQAIRGGWGADTATPDHRPNWTPGIPARDQCGVTVLVVNDLLGGELIRGEVHVNGERVDYHWRNRLGMGIEVDLTREQFAADEHPGAVTAEHQRSGREGSERRNTATPSLLVRAGRLGISGAPCSGGSANSWSGRARRAAFSSAGSPPERRVAEHSDRTARQAAGTRPR